MNDRKYRHRGYMDSDDAPRGARTGPRPPRPEGPRGRGADVDKAIVFACKGCGEKRRDPAAIQPSDLCSKCGAPLHACAQCMHFDTGARWECTQPIQQRVASKKASNTCAFYAPAQSFDLTGSRATATPDDARAAFDRLFKK